MRYIKTTIATDWEEKKGTRLLEWILTRFIPEANPSYSDKMHLVREWYIEFDDDGQPWREIGVDSEGCAILAGPSTVDYGFWLDTNMKLDDFKGQSIEAADFEKLWQASGVAETG